MEANRSALVFALAALLCAALPAAGLSVFDSTFDAGGDRSRWADAYNWAPDLTPKNVANVVEFNVTIPTGRTVAFRGQDTYAGGTLGETTINAFTLAAGSTLNLTTDGTVASSLTVSGVALLGGVVNANGVGFFALTPGSEFTGNTHRVSASGGATVAIAATSFDSRGFWYDDGKSYEVETHTYALITAAGENSRVELPGVTTLNAAITRNGNDHDYQTITASGGGAIDLSGLQTIHSPRDNDDSLTIKASGATSQVLLDSLENVTGITDVWAGSTVFAAESGAAMELPALTSLQNTRFSATSGGVISGTAPGCTWATTGLWYDDGKTYEWPSHTYALITATGAGSRVELPGIASLNAAISSNGNDPDTQTITASGGGVIDLSGLRTIHAPLSCSDILLIKAEGSTSDVLLGSLEEIVAGTGGWSGNVEFQATAGAQLGLHSLATIAGSTAVYSSPAVFHATGTDSCITLPALASMHNARFSATSGGVISGTAPGCTWATTGLWYDDGKTYEWPSHTYALITASGADSRVELPGVISLNAAITRNGNDPDYQTITASAGGVIDLSGLQTIHSPRHNTDSLTIKAAGATSQVLLESLEQVTGITEVWSGSTVFAAESGARLELPALTRLQNARFSATSGGVISGTAPGCTWATTGLWYDDGKTYEWPSHTYALITATGAGSRVELPGIASLNAAISSSGNDPDTHTITASGGGVIDLSGLRTIYAPASSHDAVQFSVTGANSALLMGDLCVLSGSGTTVTVGSGGRLEFGRMCSRSADLAVTVSGTGSSVRAHTLVRLDGADTLSLASGTSLDLGGNFFYTTSTETKCNLLSAAVSATGPADGGQILEVGGLDVGTAWFLLPDSNFAFGSLAVGAAGQPTTVRLMDIADNGNRGGQFEALYLNPTGALAGNGVVIADGATLVLGGLNVYAWEDGQLVHLNAKFGPGENEIAYGGGTLRLQEVGAALGDCTFDGEINGDDIDLVRLAAAGGSRHAFFDLDADGDADAADTAYLITEILGTFPGDANVDRKVDLADLAILATNWNCCGGWAAGDFTGDCVADLADLAVLASNWNAGTAGMAFGEALAQYPQIPEPATLALLAAGAAAMLRRRRA